MRSPEDTAAPSTVSGIRPSREGRPKTVSLIRWGELEEVVCLTQVNRRKPRYFGSAQETECAVDKTSRGMVVRLVTHDDAVENSPGVKAEAKPPVVIQWELGKPETLPQG